MKSLHTLLENDAPVALYEIERALVAEETLTDDQDAVLSALVWNRCTQGRNGLLATVLDMRCAERVEVLPNHLETVGAPEASATVIELLDEIPLSTEEISLGLADWIETESRIIERAQDLDGQVRDIGPVVWDFMRSARSDIPDLPIDMSHRSVSRAIRAWLRPVRRGG